MKTKFKNKIIIDIHKYRMNIITISDEKIVEIIKIFIPDEIINKGKLIDPIHLSYLIKKYVGIKFNSEFTIYFSSSMSLVRSIHLVKLSKRDLQGYIDYQIGEIFPVDISEYELEYTYDGNYLSLYIEKSETVELLYQCFNNSELNALKMSSTASRIRNNLRKYGLNEIEYVFIVGIGSIELVVISENNIKHYSYFEFEIKVEGLVENFLNSLFVMSLEENKKAGDYKSDITNYLFLFTDLLKNILYTLPKNSLCEDNTLILGDFTEIYDGIKFVEKTLGLDRSYVLNGVVKREDIENIHSVFHLIEDI